MVPEREGFGESVCGVDREKKAKKDLKRIRLELSKATQW